MNGLVVVDDEEGVRRSLRRVLEGAGYEVFLAENGERAIGIVTDNGQAIETVISDFKMPGLDGLETLMEIGRINPEITRIMLTGYATMESAIDAVNEGIDGFLTKPFENNELKAKVRECNLKKRLKQFVSEQILRELQRGGASILPRKQRVTVLFSDIRGFSELSEAMSPEALSQMLNAHYFMPLDNVIFEFNGTLDKHIGDSIMGVFGAPVTGEDDALRAVLGALKMRDEMNRIRAENNSINGFPAIGIGISTGEVMAGIFGSSRKKEYTVFGTPVNLASRLEHLARADQILICEETYEQVKGRINAGKMDMAPIRGIGRSLNVYSVTGEKKGKPD